jgi:hypothetical protein
VIEIRWNLYLRALNSDPFESMRSAITFSMNSSLEVSLTESTIDPKIFSSMLLKLDIEVVLRMKVPAGSQNRSV